MPKKDYETKKPSPALSSKKANMANAANADDLAMMLATEMVKQREHLKEDMAGLIKTSLAPIQASITNIHEMVDTLGRRAAAVETTTGKNVPV